MIIASTSARTVLSSSSESLDHPTIFFRQRFVDRTKRSNAPPHHGAFSTLKVQSALRFERWSCTTSSLNTDLTNLVVALKVFPLSDRNSNGNPLLAVNCLKHLIKVSAVMSVTDSGCIAGVTRQVKREIHTLWELLNSKYRTCSGPERSTPV